MSGKLRHVYRCGFLPWSEVGFALFFKLRLRLHSCLLIHSALVRILVVVDVVKDGYQSLLKAINDVKSGH